jgi:hypothetical protein
MIPLTFEIRKKFEKNTLNDPVNLTGSQKIISGQPKNLTFSQTEQPSTYEPLMIPYEDPS